MSSITFSLVNSFLITIPELVFITIITLRLMKRMDMLDFYNFKDNLISILLIASPPAIIYDLMENILKTPQTINRIISLLVLYILLIYILKKREYIEYPKLKQKAFIYLIISLFLPIAIEIISLPIIFKLLNLTYEFIKSDFYLVFLCSLSSRIIQFLILVFIFTKRNNEYQTNILDYLFKNKFFFRLTVSVLLGLIIFETFFMKSVLYNNLLNNYNSIYEQLFIVIGVTFLMPVAMILIIYSCLYYCVLLNNSEKTDFQK